MRRRVVPVVQPIAGPNPTLRDAVIPIDAGDGSFGVGAGLNPLYVAKRHAAVRDALASTPSRNRGMASYGPLQAGSRSGAVLGMPGGHGNYISARSDSWGPSRQVAGGNAPVTPTASALAVRGRAQPSSKVLGMQPAQSTSKKSSLAL